MKNSFAKLFFVVAKPLKEQMMTTTIKKDRL